MAEINPKYISDCIFLTVGTNPIPVYVSALTLVRSDGVVFLLSSRTDLSGPTPQKSNTQLLAEVLELEIKKVRPDLKINHAQVDEADGGKIRKIISNIFSDHDLSEIETFGLNYTGGTKPMGVHARLALTQQIKKLDKPFISSYLDARSRQVFFEDIDQVTSNSIAYSLARSVDLDFLQLCSLHGYKKSSKPVQHVTELAPLLEALVKVHSKKALFKLWKEWLNNQAAELSGLRNEHLQGVYDAIVEVCGGQENEDRLGQILLGESNKELKNFKAWFHGTWLELVTYQAVQKIAQKKHVNIEPTNILPNLFAEPTSKLKQAGFNANNFELDVVFIGGYRLYAISCIAADQSKHVKSHLLEIFVRAKQLGGDEARFALVCCSDKPDYLQNEIERMWYADGRIKVFGRAHLGDLEGAFSQWLAD